MDPHYVDVAVRRWQAYTGKAAVLSTTGQSFEDVTEHVFPVTATTANPSAMGA